MRSLIFFCCICCLYVQHSCRTYPKPQPTPEYELLKDIDITLIYQFSKKTIGNDPVNGQYYFPNMTIGHVRDGLYDLKTGKYRVKPVSYSLLEWVSKDSELYEYTNKIVEELFSINCDNVTLTDTLLFYSKSPSGPYCQYSDYIYTKLGIEEDVFIIFNIVGDFILIRNLPEYPLAVYNKRYSCDITENLLPSTILRMSKFIRAKPTSDEWLKKHNYVKSPVDSFRVNYCE